MISQQGAAANYSRVMYLQQLQRQDHYYQNQIYNQNMQGQMYYTNYKGQMNPVIYSSNNGGNSNMNLNFNNINIINNDRSINEKDIMNVK